MSQPNRPSTAASAQSSPFHEQLPPLTSSSPALVASNSIRSLRSACISVSGVSECTFQSPALPSLHLHRPSLGSTISFSDTNLEPPKTYERLFQDNFSLKTRMTGQEVISDLYHGYRKPIRARRRPPFRNGPSNPQKPIQANPRPSTPPRRSLETTDRRQEVYRSLHKPIKNRKDRCEVQVVRLEYEKVTNELAKQRTQLICEMDDERMLKTRVQ